MAHRLTVLTTDYIAPMNKRQPQGPGKHREVMPDDVVVIEATKAVCEVFDVEAEDMVGPRRLAPVVEARRALAIILHQQLMGPVEIAESIQRDRTTAYHFIKSGLALYGSDEIFRIKVKHARRLAGLD